jgi:hypothetical protein
MGTPVGSSNKVIEIMHEVRMSKQHDVREKQRTTGYGRVELQKTPGPRKNPRRLEKHEALAVLDIFQERAQVEEVVRVEECRVTGTKQLVHFVLHDAGFAPGLLFKVLLSERKERR